MIGIASLGTVLFPLAPGGGTQVTHGYKGKRSLLHLLVDGKGVCLAMTATGANGNERKELLKLVERVKELTGEGEMIVVEADKGYTRSTSQAPKRTELKAPAIELFLKG